MLTENCYPSLEVKFNLAAVQKFRCHITFCSVTLTPKSRKKRISILKENLIIIIDKVRNKHISICMNYSKCSSLSGLMFLFTHFIDINMLEKSY